MTTSRKLTMEDLIEKPKEKECSNNTFKDTTQIPKNQKDFGHKKRIKP
jgi:hypothetical protein